MKPTLELDNLSVGYGRRVLLKDLCASILPGQILTLIGPNGAGNPPFYPTIFYQMDKIFLLKCTTVFFVYSPAITNMPDLMNILAEKNFCPNLFTHFQRKNLGIHHHGIEIHPGSPLFRKNNPWQFTSHMQGNAGTYRHQSIDIGRLRKIFSQ